MSQRERDSPRHAQVPGVQLRIEAPAIRRARRVRAARIIQAQEPVRALHRSYSVSSDLSVPGTTDAHIRRASCMARIMGFFQRSHGISRSASLRMNRTG